MNDVSVRSCYATPVDAVIHLAAIALTQAANRDPAIAWTINAEGTAKLAAALADAAGRWKTRPLFLLASSADVYAWQNRPITESDAVQPSTPYAASKLGAELAVEQGGRCVGLPPVVVRPLTTARGGREESFVIPARGKRRGADEPHGW